MLVICLKIFLARIVDVSLGTIRTIYTVQGKTKKASIIAFFEVFIWFIIAREALNTEITSLLIPISYALGYALGTYIGSFISNNFINGYVSLQIITFKDNNSFKKALRNNNFGFSLFTLSSEYDDIKKEMYLIKTEKRFLKRLFKLIKIYDNKAFILVNDVR